VTIINIWYNYIGDFMNKNYISGIIGAIIGGLIGCIPWIVAYVYLNIMISMLAFFIAYGASMGYKLFNGLIDEKLPRIITMVSFVCVTISMLILIPCLALYNEGITPSLKLIEELYFSNEVLIPFFIDYFIAVIFMCLGIKSTTDKIKNDINKNQQ